MGIGEHSQASVGYLAIFVARLLKGSWGLISPHPARVVLLTLTLTLTLSLAILACLPE